MQLSSESFGCQVTDDHYICVSEAISSADTRFNKQVCRPSGAKRAASMWSPMTRKASSPQCCR
jgi:hypothetical protein